MPHDEDLPFIAHPAVQQQSYLANRLGPCLQSGVFCNQTNHRIYRSYTIFVRNSLHKSDSSNLASLL
ncbi:hypothetical protein CY34DRAFT_800646 [Suillus luteus UH-Slu-Lm8-n1]|uniref:Uncharacterized protein n=1 Tax=Suillus luteus UH-Slu-Lm8-n1 TaxID=930992 RepID=A0A0D0BJZ0_9AGAM|nr:hypothetical protein CY34DRAFT_800646 [Suillus luteus UH-Slu-Lm8-n1]